MEEWWSPPHLLLAGLGMGSPAFWACPGPDNGEGSGPGSGVLGEQRDGIRWGWGPDCHQKMAQVEVFALGQPPISELSLA